MIKNTQDNNENKKMEKINRQQEEIIKKTEQQKHEEAKTEETGFAKTEEKHVSKKKYISYKTKYEELHEKYLRLSAEFDNYRKRTLREKADLMKFAAEGVLQNLLPIADDFDLAITSFPEDQECQGSKEGITLIYNKLKDFLRQNGVEEMNVLHKNFDTDLHEAVTKIPAPEEKLKGKVVNVIQKGYFLKGKVLRYAKVVVGE